MFFPLSALSARRSVPARQLQAPGPDEVQLADLLAGAVRVPDHGKLVPFRLIRLMDEAKLRFGERLANIAMQRDPKLSEARREKERLRYTFAPLVLVVVACPDTSSAVPILEQQLTAGCVAYNLLLGAQALGFGAQWLTGWAAYDRQAAEVIGLAPQETVIGFIHIGSPHSPAIEREYPTAAALLSDWAG